MVHFSVEHSVHNEGSSFAFNLLCFRSLYSIKHLFVLGKQCACREGKGKGKGKAIPLQAWTGPEGSRRLKLPDFKKIGT
jgi:hypothetical protein